MRRRRRTLLNNKNTPYLEVAPTEVQWITINEPVVYNIKSNKHWSIT